MYAVIDIGSNSMRLSIYSVENNRIKLALNKKEMAGLAGYIDKNNTISSQGIEKAASVLLDFQNILKVIKPLEVFVFATASLRNINNTEEAVKKIREQSSFDVRVLTGKEEAVFDYLGALQSVDIQEGLIMDIGGGSTELIFFKNREILYADSVPIGSLNMRVQHVSDVIPTPSEISKIRQKVNRCLRQMKLPNVALSAENICGVGGTVRACEKLSKSLYNTSAPAGRCFPVENVKKILKSLKMDRETTIDTLLRVCPERVQTIVPGMVILKAVARHFGGEVVTVSSCGVREGYLYHVLSERGEIYGEGNLKI